MKGRIDDEDLVEAVGQILGIAHIIDGLPHRPERRHGDEIGLHDAAGRVLGIFEAPLDGRPLEGRKLGEDIGLVFLIEVLDEVDRLVRIELLERLGDGLVRHLLEHLIAHAFVELGERRGIEVAAEHVDQWLALIGTQQLDEIGEVCFVQIEREVAYGLGIAGLESCFDGMEEIGA